jgi:membrane associated rhomboid family serine protease/predicted negative regulator of RcsB-dependent stress response
MIIPLTHEDLEGRRWPYVTIAVIVLCTAVHIYVDRVQDGVQKEFREKAVEAVSYYLANSHLKAPPELVPYLPSGMIREAKIREKEEARSRRESEGAEHATSQPRDPDGEQAQLDRLVAEMLAVRSKSPWFRFGYVPRENSLVALFTSQFLHGDWLHLIFNMWFLWLAGCNIEDRWGRALFPIFYLCAGAVACLAQKAAAPQSIVPLVGASGAIAGAMGAFLIKFARTKIKFLWIWGFFRARTFDAPAWFMLPLWLASQIFWGLLTLHTGLEGGVAFWAHVGGFVFGMAFAFALQKSGLEARIDSAIENQISVRQCPEIEQANQLIDQKDPQAALALLEPFCRRNPTNIDAQLALLRAAKTAGDQPRELRAYVALLAMYLQQAPETAIDLYEEMHNLGLDTEVPAPLRLRLARQLERMNYMEGAASEYLNLYSNGGADTTSYQALIALANLKLRQRQKREAVQLFEAARTSPFPHLEWEPTILTGLRQAHALPE